MLLSGKKFMHIFQVCGWDVRRHNAQWEIVSAWLSWNSGFLAPCSPIGKRVECLFLESECLLEIRKRQGVLQLKCSLYNSIKDSNLLERETVREHLYTCAHVSASVHGVEKWAPDPLELDCKGLWETQHECWASNPGPRQNYALKHQAISLSPPTTTVFHAPLYSHSICWINK